MGGNNQKNDILVLIHWQIIRSDKFSLLTVARVHCSVSDSVSWVKFTSENIARSRGEREISEKLRTDIEICLRQCANDMVSQFQFINNALKARIQENTDVKHRLEMHLQKVYVILSLLLVAASIMQLC